MIGRGNQQPCSRPVINLLKKNSNEALQLAHIGRIVPALGNRVELIQQQNAIDALRIVQNMAHIGAGPSEKTAHDGGEIEREKRTMQLTRDPAGGQGLSYSWRACENDRAGRRQPVFRELVEVSSFREDLLQEPLHDRLPYRLNIDRWNIFDAEQLEARFQIDRYRCGDLSPKG